MAGLSPDLTSGIIIRSRVRLARNLKGYPFRIDDVAVARDIVKKVNRALVKADTFNLYFVANLSDIKLSAMQERYLISRNLIENRECGAALVNSDESVSVMIHEEDVLRDQCFMKGLRLSEAYRRISAIDDELAKNLDIAYSERFGYLTACTTNVGTGLRASVMLFLPALTLAGKMKILSGEIAKLGLTVRGAYGEGSRAEGYAYQISNEVTLGVSEYEIIKSVEDAVERICELERNETQKLFGKNELKTMDRARKSFGILTNAVLLPYDEFLEHISEVKLGALLGVIDISEVGELDDLIISVRPANLCEQYGKKLSATDRDLFRAEIVGKKLQKLKEN
ncbi:MAG: ATP--guanido phosphotransferase [Clostridia bacterium]|nr:ATP--guanido phosphotransferase [Clostridia bacterium]